MKRPLKFRGLTSISKKSDFLYGLPAEIKTEDEFIGLIPLTPIAGIIKLPILLKTLGQYTGLKDLKEVEIYEGDIVASYGRYNYGIIEHACCGSGFKVNFPCLSQYEEIISVDNIEVRGNIHQNPELVEEITN